MTIDLSVLKRLREETGRSVAEIRAALESAGNDLAAAKELLKQSGELIVDKTSARSAEKGLIEAYVHGGRIGVMVEVNVETDFAAKSEPFTAFVHDLALHISSMAPETVEALLDQPFVKDESKTVGQLLKETISTVGENIVVKRFVRYQLGNK